jgi:hypothetical protein
LPNKLEEAVEYELIMDGPRSWYALVLDGIAYTRAQVRPLWSPSVEDHPWKAHT